MLKFKLIILAGLLALLLTACGQPSIAPVNPVSDPASAGANAAQPDSAALEADPTAQSAPTETPVDYCRSCHTDQQQLIDSAGPTKATNATAAGGDVSQSQAWEKVLVNGEELDKTVHGHIGCADCHGGVQSPEKETAHQGMIRNPSKDPETTCGECHKDIVAGNSTNLHTNLSGFWTRIQDRSTIKNHPVLSAAVEAQCSNCHATCGDCHISKPALTGGGLINGHVFNRTPSMELNCTACHASVEGDEFMGNHPGLQADVHYSQGQMTCVNCHTGVQMHGQPADCNSCHPGPQDSRLMPVEHIYEGVQTPRCESCHSKVTSGQDDVLMHKMHGAELSCQVCHSIAYTNCEGCHTGTNPAGDPTSTLDAVYQTFLIGRNPIQSYERPYRYVTVRHVPVSPDTFDAYGSDLLSRFNTQETWTYATPHNIQRNTPQTKSCNTCHGDPNLFLTADKVAPEELEANKDVIIDTLPPLISSGDQIP